MGWFSWSWIRRNRAGNQGRKLQFTVSFEGTRKASVKADERYTVEYLIGAAIRRWKLPEEEYEYYAYAHGRALARESTLKVAGIGDGDEVTISCALVMFD